MSVEEQVNQTLGWMCGIPGLDTLGTLGVCQFVVQLCGNRWPFQPDLPLLLTHRF